MEYGKHDQADGPGEVDQVADGGFIEDGLGVVQVVRVGDQQVPPALIVAGAFAAWVVVSLFLLYWIVVRS